MAVPITNEVEPLVLADIRRIAAEKRALASCDELMPQNLERQRRIFPAAAPQHVHHLAVDPHQTLPAARSLINDRSDRVFEALRIRPMADHKSVQDLFGIEHQELTLLDP